MPLHPCNEKLQNYKALGHRVGHTHLIPSNVGRVVLLSRTPSRRSKDQNVQRGFQ